MGFSVSYNVFEGTELLRDSILQIREFVDYISIVYQKKSYFGVPILDKDLENIVSLSKEGLVDTIHLYENEKIPVHHNQLNKRNIGIDLGYKNGCEYHMSMDSDEFYLKEEFSEMIDYYKNNSPKICGYCNLKSYYHTPEYQIRDRRYIDDDLFVSLFFNSRYRFIQDYPLIIKVDPTRKPNMDKIKIFDNITMHHMSYVRENIENKLKNAPSFLRYGGNNENVERAISHYKTFTGEKLYMFNADGQKLTLKKLTKPLFNLSYGKN